MNFHLKICGATRKLLISNETIWDYIYSIIKNMFLCHICGTWLSQLQEHGAQKAKYRLLLFSHTHTFIPLYQATKGTVTSLGLSVGMDTCVHHILNKKLARILLASSTELKCPKITHILSRLKPFYLSQLKLDFHFSPFWKCNSRLHPLH